MSDQWMNGANVPSSSSTRNRSTKLTSTGSAIFNETIDKFQINEKLNKTEKKLKEKLSKMPAILTNAQLKNLDEHKYSSGGSTLLDPYFQVFWRWLVEQMPLWLAPNLITTIGLIINVVTCSLLFLYSPNGVDYPPWWTHILCSIGLFVYQSLDAIDGKQARRTGSSTPLGELFDHGCDAVSTVFVILGLSVSLRLGVSPWFMFLTVFLAMTAFYVAHWQTYVTGTLKFGTIDVTEAQLCTYALFFVSGVFGDTLYSMNIPILNIEFRYLPIISAMSATVFSVLKNLSTISKGGKGKNGSSVANSSIVFPVFPMLLFLFLSFSIANTSKGDLYGSNICTYLLTFGIVWVKICIKLIVAHMTKGEIFLLDTCLIGPTLLFLNQYFNYLIPEIYLLWLTLIIATYDLVRYCSKVCYQICDHMGIYLFKIKY